VSRIAGGGDALFVSLNGASGSTVLALDDRGETRWRQALPAPRVALRTDGDSVLAFEWDPKVWRLDPRSGRALWERSSTETIEDVLPMPDGMTAVVGAATLSLLDGAGRDLVQRPRDQPRTVNDLRDSRLFSCDEAGRLHAIDLRDGRPLWWARVSLHPADCAVVGASDGTVLVQATDHLIALDTTRAAPSAPAVTIRGRFKDVLHSKRRRVAHVALHVGDRQVRTDARGRFVATVRRRGPIEVRLDDTWGPQSSAVVWPDEAARRRIELTNDHYEDDSCH
jgi:outer membrane protein assembly factor BamB